MKNKFNPYKILNINNIATDDEISKAYKKLVMKYHPDKNNKENAHEIFIIIKKAYEILSNPEKKFKYDNFGIYEDDNLSSRTMLCNVQDLKLEENNALHCSFSNLSIKKIKNQ
jgi:DnaJ-class molecular chaperone